MERCKPAQTVIIDRVWRRQSRSGVIYYRVSTAEGSRELSTSTQSEMGRFLSTIDLVPLKAAER